MSIFELILAGVIFFLIIIVIYLLSQNKKSDNFMEQEKLEDEIYELKAKILDQEKIIEHSKTATQSRLALEQIKKIELQESEIQRLTRQLKEAKAIAQKAHKIKSDFLSNIRHEIRTPMNSILVFAELLQKECKDMKLEVYAENINLAGKKLLALIDEIIELSRVEKGIVTIEEEPFDIKNMLQEIMKSHREDAMKKGIDFSLDIDDEIPDSMMLDAEKIEDICVNLIENAIKFTQNGFVHISLEKNTENVVNNTVGFSLIVEDSGIGIDESDQEKIFEMFETVGKDFQQKQSLGIGLALNKKVAQQMNGDIVVESTPGEGSRFVFFIENVEVVLESTKSKEYNEENIDFSLIKPEGGTIIVVDEDREIRDLIRDAFIESNIKVRTYDNPREAIDILKKEEVDMILIDIDILTSDDNAVSKILKGISHAPVVTLTQKRLRDLPFEQRGAKIVGHLKKPLVKSDLFKIALKVLNNKKPQERDIVQEIERPFGNLEKEQIEKFLRLATNKLDALYNEAMQTNDIDTIRLFAQELLDISLECIIEELVRYANELLENIDTFDIEAIDAMMPEYREKISLLKKSIV
jgi:signal transduction histidine kinase/CheY-like chemotaxis protein